MLTTSSKLVTCIGLIFLCTACSGNTAISTIPPTSETFAPDNVAIVDNNLMLADQDQLPTIIPVATETASTKVVISTPQAVPLYQNYTLELYTNLKGTKPFVLFFHAPWCPTCQKMEREINADLATFPQGTIILKTDYDTEVALKKAWGIQVQSTVVVINAKGESVFKGTDPGNSKMKTAITQSL